MLTFEGFPDREHADRFARAVMANTKLEALVFDSQEISDQEDPFPLKLTPPIVLVGRSDFDAEIEYMVGEYGGTFAGT